MLGDILRAAGGDHVAAVTAALCADIRAREEGAWSRWNHPNGLVRDRQAERLALAILASHPEDAGQLMTAALMELRAGMPPHTAFGDIREDAAWWADVATPAELMEHMAAALRRLGRTALCLQHRKALMAQLWNSLPVQDREAFLRRADPDGSIRRTGAAT